MAERLVLLCEKLAQRPGELTTPRHQSEQRGMYCIRNALKKVEQRFRGNRASGPRAAPPTTEPSAESRAWTVEMVSPVRFVRYRGKRSERGKTLFVAVLVLALLTFLVCLLAYDVRRRMLAVTAEVNKMARQVDETEKQLEKLDGDQIRLNMENGSLRQENEAVMVELARAREALENLKARQRQPASKKSLPPAMGRKASRVAPPPALQPSRVPAPASTVEQSTTAESRPPGNMKENNDLKVDAVE